MPFARTVAVLRHERAGAAPPASQRENRTPRQGRPQKMPQSYLALVGVQPKRRRKQRLKYDTSLNPLVIAISLTRMSLCL